MEHLKIEDAFMKEVIRRKYHKWHEHNLSELHKYYKILGAENDYIQELLITVAVDETARQATAVAGGLKRMLAISLIVNVILGLNYLFWYVVPH